MDLQIKDQVALITGAGRNVGFAIAQAMAKEGVRVAINDLFADRAEQAAAAIREQGGTAMAVPGDVSDFAQVQGMVNRVVEEWGALHILVNNAGIPGTPPGEMEELTKLANAPRFVETEPKDWNKWVDVNYYGVLNCCRAALVPMQEQGYGRVISIISDAGRIGQARQSVYAGAKAAILAFSRSIAQEMAKFGITANCISLGAIIYDEMDAQWMTEEQRKERMQKLSRLYPMARALNRLGKPEDAAYAALVLAARQSEWITGQVIPVNGGYTMAG